MPKYLLGKNMSVIIERLVLGANHQAVMRQQPPNRTRGCQIPILARASPSGAMQPNSMLKAAEG